MLLIFETSTEDPVILVQLCSLQFIVMFQLDLRSRALALNHGDAATREEHLCGIVPQFIVSLLGC